LIEDLNNDDQLDFNTDPFSDGNSGIVRINKSNGVTNLEIDFIMNDGKELKGCHSGEFPIDPLITVGVETFSEQSSVAINILCNPVHDNLKFEIEAFITEPYLYYLYNSNGQLIISGSSINLYQEIDMSHVPTGPYYLYLSLKNKNTVLKKIIVF